MLYRFLMEDGYLEILMRYQRCGPPTGLMNYGWLSVTLTLYVKTTASVVDDPIFIGEVRWFICGK